MKWRRDSEHRILLSLSKGDSIKASLLQVAREANFESAVFSGIGAVIDAELGCYNCQTKQYDTQALGDMREIVSLSGNMSLIKGERFVHMHAGLADATFSVKGGHLMDAKVAIMAEIFIHPLVTTINRELNQELGLYEWNWAQ